MWHFFVVKPNEKISLMSNILSCWSIFDTNSNYKKKIFGKKKLPTKMMHMARTPNVSAFQNGKNKNPPMGPFWENQYFVSTVVRILQKIVIYVVNFALKIKNFKFFFQNLKMYQK